MKKRANANPVGMPSNLLAPREGPQKGQRRDCDMGDFRPLGGQAQESAGRGFRGHRARPERRSSHHLRHQRRRIHPRHGVFCQSGAQLRGPVPLPRRARRLGVYRGGRQGGNFNRHFGMLPIFLSRQFMLMSLSRILLRQFISNFLGHFAQF